MKKAIFLLITLLVVLVGACSVETETTQNTENAKPVILTSFYPIEEITKAIVGDTADVKLLVGYSVEPHSFEPSASQLVEVSNSDVFVTMGGIFEHVEEEVLEASSNIKEIEADHDLELIKGDVHGDNHDEHGEEGHDDHDEHAHEEDKHEEHEEHADEHHDDEHHEEKEHAHEEDEHELHDDHEEHEDHDDHDSHEEEGHEDHNHGEFDPHVWLSIHNMEKMTNEISEKLSEIYPENKELYKANAAAFIEKLKTLEGEYDAKLSSCTHDKLIVNHKAFGYIAHEYGFEQVSVAGFSPETEPSPKTIQAVIDEANEHGLTYVFSEGQIDSKTAQTIANDIGGEVLELNPLKIIPDEDYFSIMRANLDNLAIGLNCN